MSEVKDSKFIYIEDDIKKIQTKINLYLKAYGRIGVFHLGKEVIQNAWDECSNPKSCGRLTKVIIDTLENSLTVEDDGRSIPEVDYPLEICCTKMQSSTKLNGEDGAIGAGELTYGQAHNIMINYI